MADRAIRSIAIAGGGIVGLSAALAFARSVPGTRITVIATPADPAALADRMPTAWPGVARFHARVGLDELDLVRSGVASHHLGTVVENWMGEGESWVHAFAPNGKPVGGIPFDQVWRQVREGAYDDYSLGAELARAGKFVHPSNDAKALSSRFQYGLRLDPEPYRERLAKAAADAKVEVLRGEIASSAHRQDGGIRSLSLVGGRDVEADLFIDCTGPAATLISAVDDSFEDWPSHGGRLIDIGSTTTVSPTPAARIRATDGGWTGEWPLPHRTLTCTAGDEGSIPLRPGRRTRPWACNVLALGDAAVAIDPLHGLNLELVHRAIFLALDLLPGRNFNPVELAEYNRRFGLISDQVRDFIGLHYVRSRSSAEPSERLAHILDQYGYRGRLPFQEEEVLSRDDWTAALIGLGVVPQAIDPAAAAVPLDQVVPAMKNLASTIADFAGRLPTYAEYLKKMGA